MGVHCLRPSGSRTSRSFLCLFLRGRRKADEGGEKTPHEAQTLTGHSQRPRPGRSWGRGAVAQSTAQHGQAPQNMSLWIGNNWSLWF